MLLYKFEVIASERACLFVMAGRLTLRGYSSRSLNSEAKLSHRGSRAPTLSRRAAVLVRAENPYIHGSNDKDDSPTRGKATIEASLRLEKLLKLEGIEIHGDPQSSLPGSKGAIGTGSLAHHWPPVDWQRYHLQLLFVDRTHTLRWVS